MAIAKKVKDGKISYEVFVKVRDSAGKQVGLRRMGILSEREAKRVEFELKTSLKDTSIKVIRTIPTNTQQKLRCRMASTIFRM